jgi:hypothetical protein
LASAGGPATMKWRCDQGQIGAHPSGDSRAQADGDVGESQVELSQSTIRAPRRKRGSVGGLHSEHRGHGLGKPRNGLAPVFAVTAFGQLFSAIPDQNVVQAAGLASSVVKAGTGSVPRFGW